MLTLIRAILPMGALGLGLLLASLGEAEAATLVNSCQTLAAPGTYVLTANLAATGDCLVVAASSVTIDLQGFEIAGAGNVGFGVTDGGSAFKKTTIRGGSIRDFNSGIHLVSSSNILVDGMVIHSAVVGIEVGPHSTVQYSTIHDTGTAILTFGDAIVKNNVVVGNTSQGSLSAMLISSHSLVSGNTVLLNSGFTFALGVGERSTVQDNVLSKNVVSFGLSADVGSVVLRNTVLNEGVIGTGIIADCPSTVKFNTALGHTSNLRLTGTGCVTKGNNAP